MNHLVKVQQREGAQTLEAGGRLGTPALVTAWNPISGKRGLTLGEMSACSSLLVLADASPRHTAASHPVLGRGGGRSGLLGPLTASHLTALGLGFLITEMGRPFPALLSASNKRMEKIENPFL